MALANYAAVKTAVADELNRTDLSDTTLSLWIGLAEEQAEARLVDEGPVRQMMLRSDATINSEYIAIPNDFIAARAFYLTGSLNPLEFVDPEEINRRKALYPNETGDPQVWALVGSEFRFWPWASGGSYSGELTYWQKIPVLSDSNTTNWLLTAHPSAYLYGALAQSGGYLKTDATGYLTAFQAVLSLIIAADKLARTSTHLAVSPVLGGTP